MTAPTDKRLDRLLLAEEAFTDEVKSTDAVKKLENSRIKLLGYVRKVGASNDLALIVTTERRIVQWDLDRYTNSPEMARSLQTSLRDIDNIQRHIGIVADPVKYRTVDEAHSKPDHRKRLLPYDEARQAFVSQIARLGNQSKARLGDDEKQIIDARKAAFAAADKLYAQRQAKALGVDLAQGTQRATRHDPGKDQARMAAAVKANSREHLEAIRKIHGLEGKPPELLNGLAEMRALLAERDKLCPPAELAASLARFDKIATNPLFQQTVQQEATADERLRPQTRGSDEQSL